MQKSLLLASLSISSGAVIKAPRTVTTDPRASAAHKLSSMFPLVGVPGALLPAGWTSLKSPVAGKVISLKSDNKYAKDLSAEPTGYFIANMIGGSEDCSSETSYKFATATGVCFVGMTNGTAVGSLAYEFIEVSGDTILLNKGVWSSLDCTGTPEVSTMPIPTTCLPLDDGGSLVYSYTADATPWVNYDPGFMFQGYDTKDHCNSGEIGGQFAYYPLNTCIKSDDASFAFSYCDLDKGLYTIVQFTDSYCQNFAAAITVPLESCDATESNDEMSTYNFATYSCN